MSTSHPKESVRKVHYLTAKPIPNSGFGNCWNSSTMIQWSRIIRDFIRAKSAKYCQVAKCMNIFQIFWPSPTWQMRCHDLTAPCVTSKKGDCSVAATQPGRPWLGCQPWCTNGTHWCCWNLIIHLEVKKKCLAIPQWCPGCVRKSSGLVCHGHGVPPGCHQPWCILKIQPRSTSSSQNHLSVWACGHLIPQNPVIDDWS